MADSPRIPRDTDVLPGDGDLAWAGVLFCLVVAVPWLLGVGWIAMQAILAISAAIR